MSRFAFEGIPFARDANGDPVSGAKMYVYEAGTTTPLTVYSDSGLTTPLSNPVIANSAGVFPQIYAGTDDYKVVITDDADVTLYEADNINQPDIATISANFTAANPLPHYDTKTAASAATVPSAATEILVGGVVYDKVTTSYDPTHEFQFTDQGSVLWVDRNYVRVNDKMPIVVIHTGQSNSGGFSGGDGGDIASQPDVWSYERHPTGSQTTGWKLGFKESPDFPTGQDGNHFGYHFCARLARETGRPVVMIPYSIGGQDIAEWLPSGGPVGIFSDDPQTDASATGTLWTNLISAWNQALTVALPFRADGATLTSLGLTTADYLLWHQGEENRDSTATYASGDQDIKFKRDLVRVFNAFLAPNSAGSASDPLIRDSTAIIMGDLPYLGTDNIADRNPELYQIANEITNIGMAKIGWLPLSDSVHFDPDHIERIADMYYDQIDRTFQDGWDVTIDDEGLYEFRPSHVSGRYSIVDTGGTSRIHFEIGYRVSSGGGQISVPASIASVETNDNVDLTTLSNTSDAFLGISSVSGRIQMRNRRGSTLTLRIQCLTPQPLLGYGSPE